MSREENREASKSETEYARQSHPKAARHHRCCFPGASILRARANLYRDISQATVSHESTERKRVGVTKNGQESIDMAPPPTLFLVNLRTLPPILFLDSPIMSHPPDGQTRTEVKNNNTHPLASFATTSTLPYLIPTLPLVLILPLCTGLTTVPSA